MIINLSDLRVNYANVRSGCKGANLKPFISTWEVSMILTLRQSPREILSDCTESLLAIGKIWSPPWLWAKLLWKTKGNKKWRNDLALIKCKNNHYLKLTSFILKSYLLNYLFVALRCSICKSFSPILSANRLTSFFSSTNSCLSSPLLLLSFDLK